MMKVIRETMGMMTRTQKKSRYEEEGSMMIDLDGFYYIICRHIFVMLLLAFIFAKRCIHFF